MNLSVCLDAVYRNRTLADSIKAVSAIGLNAVEFWSWWDKDLEAAEQALEETGVEVTAICTRFISLAEPHARSSYLEGLRSSIEAAKRLNCRQLITQVGSELPDISREVQRESIIEGLRACVPILENERITLLVEPLNTAVDHPGYYLSSSSEAFEIIRQVGSSSVKLLYDIYHQQITEGNLLSTIRENIELIGHIHAAGCPGRNELDRGELHYPNLFEAIDSAGYSGYIGLEYWPLEEPSVGLKRLLTSLDYPSMQA